MSSGAFITSSALLVAGCLLLAVFIANTLGRGPDWQDGSVIRPGTSTVIDGAPGGLGTLPEDVARLDGISLDVIEERPLFSATRRPPEAGTTAAEPLSGLEDFELVGTMLWDDDERRAVIRIEGAEKHRIVRQGESLRGWTVLQVKAREIELERDGARETLELRYGAMPGVREEAGGGRAGPLGAGEASSSGQTGEQR